MRVVGLLCLCLLACDDEADTREVIEVGVVVDTPVGVMPISDGATVPFEWGFQGGTMIRPGVLIPAGVADEDEDVRLIVRHRPDPDAPAAFGDAGDYDDVVRDRWVDPYSADKALIGPVDLQLGSSGLGGMRLLLDITVSGRAFKGHTQVRVEVEGGNTPCDDYPTEGNTCVYRALPLSMRVFEYAPAPDCPDAVIPIVDYASFDPDLDLCLAWTGFGDVYGGLPFPGLESGADPDCLTEIGLGLDESVWGDVALQVKGTCAPVVLQPDIDASACARCE